MNTNSEPLRACFLPPHTAKERTTGVFIQNLSFHYPRASPPPETWFRGMSVGGSFRRVQVGPGSPSADAANWLPSRFGLSVETRRRYSWLRMVFSGVRPFRAPIWCPSRGWRHARGREHRRREPGSALIGWVRTRFGEGGGQLNRRRARGGLNPCARESKARTGRFLRGKLMSDHGSFSSYEGHKKRRMGKIRGAFSRMHRALEGWMLARAPASPAQGFHHHGPR